MPEAVEHAVKDLRPKMSPNEPSNGHGDPGWAAGLVPEFSQGMTERAWTMLRLIYFTGLSQREVASRLQVTVGEVATEVARSLQIVSGIVLTPR